MSRGAPKSASGNRKRRRIGKPARRALIVAAALEVFARDGYRAASLEEIAERAGVTRPVLYDHFPSKAALHLALLKEQRDELFEVIRPHLESSVTPGESEVRAALEAFFGWTQRNPFAWRMLFQDTTGEPEVVRAHDQIRAEAHVGIVRLVLGSPSGSTAAQQAAIAALVGGAIDGLTAWWYRNSDFAPDQLAQLVMDVLWPALVEIRGPTKRADSAALH